MFLILFSKVQSWWHGKRTIVLFGARKPEVDCPAQNVGRSQTSVSHSGTDSAARGAQRHFPPLILRLESLRRCGVSFDFYLR
jgi:hypothetical protein